MKRPCGVLLDLSGVLYVGEERLPGAREAVERLLEAGMPVALITNTTRSPRRAILEKLRRLGFDFPPDLLFTPSQAVRNELEATGTKAYMLIHPNLREELGDLEGPPFEAVVVGDAGEAFTYANLNRAFRLLMEGCPLLAMGRTRYFREPDGLSLDVGPFVAALEYAAGVEAVVLGKPAEAFFLAAVRVLGCEPPEVVMVGDDVDSDVIAARQAGLQALLVRTGKYRPGDDEKAKRYGAGTVDDIRAAVEEILR